MLSSLVVDFFSFIHRIFSFPVQHRGAGRWGGIYSLNLTIQQQAGSSQWIALLVCRTTKNFYCTNKNIERRCN